MRTATLGLALALLACSPPPSSPPLQASAPTTSWITPRAPLAYDGDTIYVIVAALPPELAEMSVRVRGIDTPEIQGKCDIEKAMGIEARDYVRAVLRTGKSITFTDIEHDKYGGRILANVHVDGHNLSDMMIAAGLGRAYDGGKRQGWC